MRLTKDDGSLTGFYVYFERTPTVANYHLYEGTLGTYYSHGSASGNQCDMAATDLGTGVMRAEILPSGGDHYYLVTGHSATVEGPSGYKTDGTERDPSQNTCLP